MTRRSRSTSPPWSPLHDSATLALLPERATSPGQEREAAMTEIEWVDGPTRSRADWAETLAPLMEHPGQWAIVARKSTPEQAYTAAGNLRARIKSVPAGIWEFRGEATEDRTGVVKACYRGPEPTAKKKS